MKEIISQGLPVKKQETPSVTVETPDKPETVNKEEIKAEPKEENRSVSEPSAAEPVMEKLSAPAGGREKQSEELTEADLWNQWVARTGDYRLSKDAIAAAAGHLTPEQALTLCKRYREQHPQLYAGIRKYADWYERSEPAAKIIGLRMEALMKQGGIIRRR